MTGDQQTKPHVSPADKLPRQRGVTATEGIPTGGVHPSTIYIN